MKVSSKIIILVLLISTLLIILIYQQSNKESGIFEIITNQTELDLDPDSIMEIYKKNKNFQVILASKSDHTVTYFILLRNRNVDRFVKYPTNSSIQDNPSPVLWDYVQKIDENKPEIYVYHLLLGKINVNDFGSITVEGIDNSLIKIVEYRNQNFFYLDSPLVSTINIQLLDKDKNVIFTNY